MQINTISILVSLGLVFTLQIEAAIASETSQGELANKIVEQQILPEINIILTGTIVQKNAAFSIAQIFNKTDKLENSYLVGDEITNDIKLLEIEKEKILVEQQDKKFWIVFVDSNRSDIISYVSRSIALPINRLDSPEFYNENGILMEGAAALKYGIAMDAEPVVEQVSLDARLESLPEGTQMRGGIPKSWWNPMRLHHDATKNSVESTKKSKKTNDY